jgi:hypothetical protein
MDGTRAPVTTSTQRAWLQALTHINRFGLECAKQAL